MTEAAQRRRMGLVPENVSSRLEPLLLKGMDKPSTGRIGMRSGASHLVNGIRLIRIDPVGDTDMPDYEIVGYSVTGQGLHDEVRFLANDVESVTLLGCKGIAPEQADKTHGARSATMIDTISGPGHEELLTRFHRLGVVCANDVEGRLDWFREIVGRQLKRLKRQKVSDLNIEALEGLLSGPVEARDAPAATMLLLVDFCYNALDLAYEPYMDEDEWNETAMDHVDRRLHSYGV